MNCNCVLNNCVFLLILCIFMFKMGYSESDHTETTSVLGSVEPKYEAPLEVHFFSEDIMQANVILNNIPKDTDYTYAVYGTDRLISKGNLTEGKEIQITDEFKTPNKFVIYFVKLVTKDDLECERVQILTAKILKDDNHIKKCLQHNACIITVDLNETCRREKYDLTTTVISEHTITDEGVLRYNIGEELKLLCSEKTRNKELHLHWNIRGGSYNESTTCSTENILYDLNYAMTLKTFDNGIFVYCSVSNSNRKIVNTTSRIKLELISQSDSVGDMNAVYLDRDTKSVTLNCGKGYNRNVKFSNNEKIATYYCLHYTKTCKTEGIQNPCITRHTYNETIYYLQEKGSQSLGTIIGACVAIVFFIIAIVCFSLYRRRQRRDVQNTVTYSTASEVVYAQLQMPASTSNRPRVEIEASPYAQVIGVLAPKQTHKKNHK